MALEGGDGVERAAVEIAGGSDLVAVFRQQFLHFLDDRTGFAEREDRSARFDGSRLDPEADAGIGERLPWKLLARVLLARRCDIGMGEHAVRRDSISPEDAATERRDRGDLSFGKGGIAVVVPR